MNFDQPLTPSRSNLPLVFHGYEEVQPTNRRCDDNFYFPVSAERNATISKEKKSRRTTVAITIPCYNEEAESLRRTLKCLSEQDLPDNIHIETVIVMDGATQISESMNLYLEELFQLDPTLDPFFSRFDKNINTVIIEPTFTYDSCNNKANSMMEKCDDACSISDDPDEQPEQVGPSETSHPDLHLSLVVKRNNQRKVNSQMWALASHAKACNCDFVFLTDCGTGFDKDCLRFLLDPMLEDITIGVTSGYQRGMSAALQGCGKNEWWHNPGNFILRQGQIFDHELAYSSSKGLHNRLGFLSVVPGPCGLYRYDCLGSIESGIMKTYFELSTCAPQNQCDLILGNTQLAEDRFPPILLTLQTTAQCKTQGTTSPCPRAHFVPDAIYYFEAEIPLQSLVKQRRRWNNGAFFSAVWFLSSDWLWQSNHSTFFKLVVLLTSGCETILVSLLFAIFMPPTIACSLYGSASGYLGGDIKIAFEPQKESIDLHSTMLALIPSLAYMLVYTVFIVGHIPRAVPVKQEQNQHTLDVELSNASEEAPAPPTQWRADHRSAYRPGLWRLAIATNVLASLCVLPWMIIALLYHVDEVSTMRWCMLVSLAIFYASVVSGICERRTPSLRAFWNLAVRFPLMLGLGGFSMMNWCQCYSFARISDLSWGNRAGAHDETVDTQVAKRRAHLGKLFALSLLFLNFVSYAAFSFWTIYDNRAVLYLIMMILAPSTFLMSLHGMASFYHGLRRLVSFTWKRVQLLMLLLLLLLLRCRRSSGFRSDGSDTMAPATVSGDHVVEDRDIEDTEFMSLNSTSLDSVSLNSASIRSSIDIIIYAGSR